MTEPNQTELESTLTLYPTRLSKIGLFLVSAAFVAGGLWMVSEGESFGYVCVAFFGLCLLVATVQLIPGSSYLKLEPSGFTYCALFRVTVIPWSDVEEFLVVTMKQTGVKVQSMVGFNYVENYDRSRLGRRISSAIGMCEAALPDTYGKTAEELATLMNERLAIAKASVGVIRRG